MIAPENISTDHAQNIKEMNMWNGNRIVFGESRSKWSLLLKGREWLPYNTKTITGYFNNYDIGGEEWQYSPQQMADGSINLYAASKTVNEIELLTSNSLIEPLQYGNTVVKVEIRARHRTYTATTGTIALRPVFSDGDGDNHILNSINLGAWSEWFDITEDTNAPSTWTWEDVNNLDVNHWMVKTVCGNPNGCQTARIEIRVTWHDSVTLSGPLWNSLDNKLDKQLKPFNLWKDYKLHDEGIAGQPLNFEGIEVGICKGSIDEYGICFPLCMPICFNSVISTSVSKSAAQVAQEKFAKIHNWIEKHYNITLSEFGDCFNAEYAIVNFTVQSMKHPSNYKWILTLEKA